MKDLQSAFASLCIVCSLEEYGEKEIGCVALVYKCTRKTKSLLQLIYLYNHILFYPHAVHAQTSTAKFNKEYACK
jgi:hypothetical protein